MEKILLEENRNSAENLSRAAWNEFREMTPLLIGFFMMFVLTALGYLGFLIISQFIRIGFPVMGIPIFGLVLLTAWLIKEAKMLLILIEHMSRRDKRVRIISSLIA